MTANALSSQDKKEPLLSQFDSLLRPVQADIVSFIIDTVNAQLSNTEQLIKIAQGMDAAINSGIEDVIAKSPKTVCLSQETVFAKILVRLLALSLLADKTQNPNKEWFKQMICKTLDFAPEEYLSTSKAIPLKCTDKVAKKAHENRQFVYAFTVIAWMAVISLIIYMTICEKVKKRCEPSDNTDRLFNGLLPLAGFSLFVSFACMLIKPKESNLRNSLVTVEYGDKTGTPAAPENYVSHRFEGLIARELCDLLSETSLLAAETTFTEGEPCLKFSDKSITSTQFHANSFQEIISDVVGDIAESLKLLSAKPASRNNLK